MKKTTKVMAILLCAVTIVMLNACSKEDSYQRRIIGKWECVHAKLLPDNPVNIDPNQYDDSNIDNAVLIWEFSSDGIVKATTTDWTYSYTYSITEEYLEVAGTLFQGSGALHIYELTNSSLIVWQYVNGSYFYLEFQRVR